MKRTAQLLALVFMITIGFWVVTGFTNTSPGRISAVHASLPELRGAKSCEACHGEKTGSMAQACEACHERMAEQRVEAVGFHGTLPVGQQTDCGHCHLEHLGTSFPLIDDRAFQKAGWQNYENYAHEKLGYELVGRHLELGCVECHEHAEASQVTTGQHRFTGLAQTCTGCHDDPHKGKAKDCNACHGQTEKFETVALFEHDTRFPLTGGHAEAACTDCHEDGDYRTYMERAGELQRSASRQENAVRTCASCHESPHTQGFISNIASSAGHSTEQTCTLCHAIEDKSLAEPELARTLRFHDETGFPLRQPHLEIACAACHGTPLQTPSHSAEYDHRFPGRKPESCASCHGDPHEGQFTLASENTTPASQPSCKSCHNETEFTPHKFNLERHAKTQFPLHGAHESLACKSCHETKPGSIEPDKYPLVRQFRGTTKACQDCHDSPHLGQFDGGAFAASQCTTCHGQESFFPSKFTAEMHSKTSFALAGAHLAVACRDCHTPTRIAGNLPSKPLGNIAPIVKSTSDIGDRIFHGTASTCKACHLDVHDGAFERRGVPASVGDKQGCQRCHGQASFAFADRKRFRHGLWTGFNLHGAHKKADCSQCHLPSKATHAGTRTMGKAKSDCADCHSDPHAGQFERRGRTDCGRCHSAAGTDWDANRFRHNLHARFTLDRDHSDLACVKCHKTYRQVGGKRLVRYKPLGTTCKACHGWENRR